MSYASLLPLVLALAPAVEWRPLTPLTARSERGATLRRLADDSIRATGKNPARDVYVVEFVVRRRDLGELRIEALADGAVGPGRTPHGNFVISGVELWMLEAGEPARRIALRKASADFEQPGYPAVAALDGKKSTGWAIHGPIPRWRRDRTITIRTAANFRSGSGVRIRLVLRQEWGCQSALRRFRVSVRHRRQR